jgi:hypothetical protein
MSADDKGFRLLGLSAGIRLGSTNTIVFRMIPKRLDASLAHGNTIRSCPEPIGDLRGEIRPLSRQRR